MPWRPLLKLGQLQALIAVANAGSINGAAASLALSQPAVSKAISSLELEIGAPLLIRQSRGISLTACGEAVFRRALSIVREIEKAHEEIDWIKGEKSGRVSIGATPLAATRSLAAAIAAIRQDNPLVQITLSEQRPHQILDDLRTGRHDVGVVTLFGGDAITGFEGELLRSHPTQLVRGGQWPSQVTLEELVAQEWVDYEQTGHHKGYIHALMSAFDLPLPARITRSTSMAFSIELAIALKAVFALAEAGIPYLARRCESGELTVLDPQVELPPMNIFILFRDWQLLSPSAKAFVRMVRMQSRLAASPKAWVGAD